MSFFTRECMETLREKIDLVELVSSHVPLKRSGASFKACCPFHEEKTPSFVIQRGASHYHCFGCGAHGDAIAFLMLYLNMGFVEAVQYLSERFHVPLEYEEEGRKDSGVSRRRLKEVLQKAAEFYHFCLLETVEGREALQYLFARGIERSFIDRFTLGYAPRDRAAFTSVMSSQKITDEELEQVGLLLVSERGKRDFFSQRILFPVRDKLGAVIGFSGRKIDERISGGKYINTPETLLFKKSKILFGLYESRKRIAKEKRAIVVEGQIDALRLIHEGIDFTVAGQGTAFGSEHVAELAQLGITQVFLALDGDDAGKEAAYKIGNLFQSKGVEVRIVPIPNGSDPDQLIREKGKEAFLSLLEQSDEYVPFSYRYLTTSAPPGGKHHLLRKLTEQIRSWEEPVLVYESLKRLSSLSAVPLNVLGVEAPPQPKKIERKGFAGFADIDPDAIIEADVLRWLFVLGASQSALPKMALENLSDDDFCVEVCQELFSLYMRRYEEEKSLDLLSFSIALEDDQLRAFVMSLSDKKIQLAKAEEGLKAAIGKVLDRNWMKQRANLQKQIERASSNDEALALAAEFDLLKKQPPVVKV